MGRPWKAKLGSKGWLRLLGRRIQNLDCNTDSERAIKLMRIIRHMLVENLKAGKKVRIPGIGTIYTRVNKAGRKRIALYPDKYLKGVVLHEMPLQYERDDSLIHG